MRDAKRRKGGGLLGPDGKPAATDIVASPALDPMAAPAGTALEQHEAETEGDVIEREMALKALKGELPFETTFERILVQEDPPASKLGVLLIPQEYRQKTCRGVIVGAGCGARDTMLHNDHRIGDRIFYAKWTGVFFPWRGKQVFLMPTKDILGNFNLAQRLDAGEVEYAVDADGHHFIRRVNKEKV